MYNIKSNKAEEFINDSEIRETMAYARENSNNIELIKSILQKARECKGLTHREAALLLECNDADIINEIYDIAREIKHKFYGNRIVMFAPLYLSNYCVNGCVYCPYHLKNKTIRRKKLSQEEIRQEVIALQDMGHKRLALEAGEHPVENPIEYIFDSGKLDQGILEVKYSIPYADIDHLDDPEIKQIVESGGYIWSHTLEDQIQGQIAAGFAIIGFYEDIGGTVLDNYINSSIATKTIKL